VEEILELPAEFVPKIVGGQLVRIRSQTVNLEFPHSAPAITRTISPLGGCAV
jgi:hypothetical protein